MLLEFRVSNYRSFDEEQVFSFVASKDKALEDSNVHTVGDQRVLKAAALYGANASGKSNLIKALEMAGRFVANSATKMNLGDKIPVEPFMLRASARNEPSRFEFSLLIDGDRFEYGFAATADRVHEEWIIGYKRNKEQVWLDRTYDTGSAMDKWKFAGPLELAAAELQARTRANGLALARAAELNFGAVVPLYLWFKNRLRVFSTEFGSPPPGVGAMSYTLALFREEESFREFAKRLVADADTGIVDLAVRVLKGDEVKLPQELPAELREKILKTGSFVDWSAEHRNHLTRETARFDSDGESTGTQALLGFSGPFWDSIRNRYTLVIDEIEASMHPHLVRRLVSLFQGEAIASHAQLLFATHDSTLLDLSLLRRDQVWLMEKGPTGATEMYSLWDFGERPRNTEAIQRGYLAGRYGGVPNFGPTLEAIP